MSNIIYVNFKFISASQLDTICADSQKVYFQLFCVLGTIFKEAH